MQSLGVSFAHVQLSMQPKTQGKLYTDFWTSFSTQISFLWYPTFKILAMSVASSSDLCLLSLMRLLLGFLLLNYSQEHASRQKIRAIMQLISFVSFSSVTAVPWHLLFQIWSQFTYCVQCCNYLWWQNRSNSSYFYNDTK